MIEAVTETTSENTPSPDDQSSMKYIVVRIRDKHNPTPLNLRVAEVLILIFGILKLFD